jgi:exopolysaccharide biosynthesis predicted pyruvyltransferase EpsI
VISVILVQFTAGCERFDSRENVVAQELHAAVLHTLVVVLQRVVELSKGHIVS